MQELKVNDIFYHTDKKYVAIEFGSHLGDGIRNLVVAVLLDNYNEWKVLNQRGYGFRLETRFFLYDNLQFISTYKDYLKDKIIKELKEHFKDVAKVTSVIYYVERKCFTVVLDYGKLATQMVYKYDNNRIAFGRHYTPLQLLKQIIEFFEMEVELWKSK